MSSSPAGITDCNSTCSANFNAAAVVTLTATEGNGSTFAGWSGGGCTGTGACVVTMNAAKSVTASFAAAFCTTPVSGGLQWSNDNATLAANPSTYGTCLRTGATYQCSFSAPQGISIALIHTNGNNSSRTKTITANCLAQTNVNLTNN